MPIRIAMCSWESMHSIAVGGLAPHVTFLSEALSKRGHEVHVFTRMASGQSPYELVDRVHYHRCPFEPHDDFLTYVERMCNSFVWHLAETEHFLGRPFDVVHGHDWLSAQALAQAKNRHRRPTVFTIHSTEYGRCGNVFRDDPVSRRVRDLEWEGAYVANRVICVSKTLGREVQHCYGVPGDKIVPVYNGIDVTKYDAPVDQAGVRRRFAVGLDDPMVLFAGRMTWQKGPDLLLDAVPRVLSGHPRTKIVFAGDGDMLTGLEGRASSLGVGGATRFVGHRQGQDLVDLFRAANLVCVPSRNEPFGIVILEAWSAGKPVVATRIGGPAEFVRDDYSGVTVDARIDTVGTGLQKLLADERGARRMGRNGRKEAESRFTWDHAAAATELVYHSALGVDVSRSAKVMDVSATTERPQLRPSVIEASPAYPRRAASRTRRSPAVPAIARR